MGSLIIHTVYDSVISVGAKQNRSFREGCGMDGMGVMKLRLMATAFALIGLGACATVDIADMTTMAGNAPEQTKMSSNVVVNASEKLYASFEEKGLCQSSEERMKSAAATLLKGRNSVQSAENQTYLDKAGSLASVQADIASSAHLIRQTQRAADVYIELAEPAIDLRPELKSLEQAFYATQSARRFFVKALENLDADASEHLADYDTAQDQLRVLTNQYGDRVRAQADIADNSAS